MRYIRQKLLAHLIDFFLLLNILLQLVIGCLQFRNGLFQGCRQLIDILSQQIYLIVGTSRILRLKIQMHHFFRYSVQFQNGFRNLTGYKPCDNTACQSRQHTDICQKTIGNFHAFPNAFHRRTHDKRNAGIQPSVHLHILIASHADLMDYVCVILPNDLLHIRQDPEKICHHPLFQLFSAVNRSIPHL